ncbi:hypothetical protein BOV88_10275 [Solemya velum gill symbiont]|uniref:DUF6362 domain-containing protein n=1 Tax=Solemya velum gill symbiont TaxID=2340 RepID=A0A1T2CHS0_SOVGS|nr:hypothetical protein BOV88_10275 [Solemya velum gill symbiont]OOY37108.1 hypothetical protein BOV89_09145 [Solemya velum gill symbiont]OOY45649.1 hypothetical protein BOV93_12640 [Solemya velum gill symbiont]
MNNFTPEYIALRFEECVSTLRKLPGERSLGYVSYWPEIKYDRRELARQEVQTIRLRPTPDKITRMEETLSWITFVNHGERNLIWLRAYRTPWRVISRETGFPRTSAQRYWQGALIKIAERLAQEQRPAC